MVLLLLVDFLHHNHINVVAVYKEPLFKPGCFFVSVPGKELQTWFVGFGDVNVDLMNSQMVESVAFDAVNSL